MDFFHTTNARISPTGRNKRFVGATIREIIVRVRGGSNEAALLNFIRIVELSAGTGLAVLKFVQLPSLVFLLDAFIFDEVPRALGVGVWRP